MMIEAISLEKAAPLISKLASTFAAPAKGVATRAKEKLEVKLQKGFSKFLEENLNRFSTVKTIISSNTPIPFSTLYVNLYAANPRSALRDDDFLKEIAKYKSVLFTATAGSGKSMLMRYLFLRLLEAQTERLPVFIELRELNENPSATLQDYVRKKISDYIAGFSAQQLRYAFETGKIVLFLDGFDEIDHDKRADREREINELIGRFKDLWVFVSSRPAETFASWEKFFVFKVQPFTRKQVELLISKIEYDPEIKALFRKKLSEGLYETHKEFLTNPLLTIMMLITLEQFAEVPAKIHLFYEYAFEALFGRHDATKGGGFQRKRHTTLALDDFKRLFAYFCAITYMKQLTTFSASKVLEIIQQSIESSQIKAEKTSFRGDLTECTCMLILDGLDYTFSHRSFQEYFCAYFLSRIKVDEFERALPMLVGRGGFDNVLRMVSEMNNEKFEEAWAAPMLETICKAIQKIDARNNCLGFTKILIGGTPRLHLRVENRPPHPTRSHNILSLTFSGNAKTRDKINFADARLALYHVYGIFDQIQARLKDAKCTDEEIERKILAGELLGNDPRFDAIRKSSKRNEDIVELRIEDSEWLRDTFIAQFMELESELLPKLRDEVKLRVERRKQGVAEIFPV